MIQYQSKFVLKAKKILIYRKVKDIRKNVFKKEKKFIKR